MEYKKLDEDTKIDIAQNLAGRTDEESFNALKELIKDRSELVRVNACDSMYSFINSDALKILMDTLRKDRSSLVRMYAVLSIGDIILKAGLEESHKLYTTMLKEMVDKEKSLRVKIAYYEVLSSFGVDEYFTLLLKQVDSTLYTNRICAIKALARLATKNNKNIILEKLENRREVEKVFAVIDTIENVYKKITQI